MKNFVMIAGMVLALSGIVLADSVPVSIGNQAASTNSVVSAPLNGFLEAFVINVTGTTTQTITAVSARTGETVLTKTTSADVVIRPSTALQTTAGVSLSGVSNQVTRFYLSNDALTFTVTETAPVTNTTAITILTSN